MSNNFFAYIQKLELMAFFSGYSLLYAIILVLAGNNELRNNLKKRIVLVLPLSYALISTLYLGLQLKNLYLSYSGWNVGMAIHHPFLMIWGLLAVVFWIPLFRKKVGITLLHNLAFFFILVKDIFIQIGTSVDEHILKNDMRIFTASFLLNLATFILLLLLYLFFAQLRKVFRNK